MSFVSNLYSSETLLRGIELPQAPDMSLDHDPSPEELKAEIKRLEESHSKLAPTKNNKIHSVAL